MTAIDPAAVICQKSSLTRLHQRVQQANEIMPVKCFKKTINGQPVEYLRKPKAVTGSVEATMERLIKDYVRDYHGILKRVGPSALEEGLFPLRTCRAELAGRRTISEKTAYNHLRKLRDLGFISRYKFRGSRHAFEIWIDPALLFQPERTYPQPVVEGRKASENQPLKNASFSPLTANFTAYKVTVTYSNSETESIKADGNVHSDAPEFKHGDEKHGNTEQLKPETPSEAQKSSLGTPGHGDKGRGGAAGAVPCGQVDNAQTAKPAPMTAGQRARLTKAEREALMAKNRTDAQRKAILEGWLNSFWQYAKQLLYSAKTFAPYEEELAIKAIKTGVYDDFKRDLTEKEWDAYQAELYQRLELAAGYYQRHEDKWVPAPYAQMRPGCGYFDAENQRGFSQTLGWIEENRKKIFVSRATQQINLAVRHLQLHRIGKAPRAIQEKTYLDAYLFYKKKFEGYATEHNALTRFQNLVATLGDRNPKFTPGFTKNFKK